MKNSLPAIIGAVFLGAAGLYGCSNDSAGVAGSGCPGGCPSGQVCVKGVCEDDTRICAQPCGEACCANSYVCDEATLTCRKPINDRCYSESDCPDGEICADGTCRVEAVVCTKDNCTGEGAFCDAAGKCQTCSNTICAGTCCTSGQLCDDVYNACANACADNRPTCGEECCEADQTCQPSRGHCVRNCQDGREACGVSQTCCGANQLCTGMQCVADCAGMGKGALCGDVCCEAGEFCDADRRICLKSCTETQVLCGSGNAQSCCNNTTQICYNNACIPRGEACSDTKPCKSLTDFCEELTGTCVDMQLSPTHCIYVPPVGVFSPEIQWQWQGAVLGSAIVINLTDDNGDGKIDENDIPDVVFVTTRGELVVLSGDTGAVLARSNNTIYAHRNDLGAAKVDGDQYPEIVVGSRQSVTPGTQQLIRVLNLVPKAGGGYELVVKKEIEVPNLQTSDSNATDLHPSFADVDNDGRIEIITTRGILKDDLTWKCQFEPTFTATYGNNYLDDVIVADLDGDGYAEIISRNIYDHNCNIIIPASSFPASSSAFSSSAHHFAVADLDGDGMPEIVRVADERSQINREIKAEISIWKPMKSPSCGTASGWCVERLRHAEIPISVERARVESYLGNTADCTVGNQLNRWQCNAWGGPPVIADFDGDGKPDIGLASTWAYIVYRNDLSILWQDLTTQDWSSGRTGSSVFDFEGDGLAEVIYRDEKYLRIYSGKGDGMGGPKVLFQTPSTSDTVTEYPLIVDVDNDGKSEIVMVSYEGVTVYRDALNNWVRTRRIWNQHSYHVTNINEDGTVPTPEEANWKNPRLNNYRQNVQTTGLFNAPNLVPGSLQSSLSRCSESIITLTAIVQNIGALSIPAGLIVNFYVKSPTASMDVAYIGQAKTTKSLGIGEETSVTLAWNQFAQPIGGGTPFRVAMPGNIFFIVNGSADGDPNKKGVHNECNESDNTSITTFVPACPVN